MAASRHDPESVDAYIHGFGDPTRSALIALREIFRNAMPGAEEFISYRIPTFRADGVRLHFAGYDSHLGVYPVHTVPQELEPRVAPLRSGAATLRLPGDEAPDAPLVSAVIASQIELQHRRRTERT